ncbi:MAG: DUF6516 family protein [Candidatus Desantisbacteria bacterium]
MREIQEYFDKIKLKLMESEFIESFQVRNERIIITDGYIKIRGRLINGDIIELSEYCRYNKRIITQEYTFHWQDSTGKLIMRWDNANHHPEIKNFPHHVHIKEESNILPSNCESQQTVALLEKLNQLYFER